MAESITVELVFAVPDRQVLLALDVAGDATVADVIAASGIQEQFPDAAIAELEAGIWGNVVSRDRVVREGDRIELYRRLRIDPREARRRLAEAGRTMATPPSKD